MTDAVYAHVADTIGPIAGAVELPTEAGPMALIHVPATEHKPFQVLVTAGLSRYAMPIPEDEQDEAVCPHAELTLALPPDWPIDEAHFSQVVWSWPLRLLASVAAFPPAYAAWLAPGHTIPNGDPPKPYVEGLDFSGVLIAPPLLLLPEARRFRGPEGPVELLAVVPLFEREMELKTEKGAAELFSRLDRHGVTELLNVHRRATAGMLLDLLDGAGDA